MSTMTEDERAALWQQQTRDRIAYRLHVWESLRAPPEPRQQVLDDWGPITMLIADKQAGPTDPKDDP